ncbi:MAG: MerR family transcriptional regulator [Pseudomonadota bacterium]
MARQFGLSRSTLLYYDRAGLLQPTARSPVGYRLYDRNDIERLKTIRAYRDLGLGVDDIKDLLSTDDDDDQQILHHRLIELDKEIAGLRIQQRVLLGMLRSEGSAAADSVIDKEKWIAILRSSGLNDDDMERWHRQFEHDAPAAHHAFLLWLGIGEDEALAIRTHSSG